MVAITIKAIWGWNFLCMKDLINGFSFLNNHKTIHYINWKEKFVFTNDVIFVETYNRIYSSIIEIIICFRSWLHTILIYK